MSTTQAYGTYMFIGAVIFVGYIFVSAGNFVEPHGIHVEELDSIELPKDSKIFKLTEDKNLIDSGVIKEKVQKAKGSESVVDHSRQRRSLQIRNVIKNDIKSMEQKDNQNELQTEEKQKKKEGSPGDGLKQPQSARRLKSSAVKVKNNEPVELKVKTSKRRKRKRKRKVNGNSKIKQNNNVPIALSPKKKKKKKRKRVIKIQKEQKLSAHEKSILQEKLIRSFGKDYKGSESYKTIVDKCSEYKTYKGRILFFDTTRYLETQPNLCNGDIHLIFAVHTRPFNFARRELIRNTFGSMRYIKGKRIALVFFVGSSVNKEENEKLRKEAKSYQDIVQRDFVEHYRNMTYKHLTVMDWLMEFCPNAEYLVKVDDDVFANIFQVVEYIDTFSPQTFYCTKTVGPTPQRSSGKWKVTYDEYPKSKFPPYCMGYAYLMKASLAKELYWCSVYSKSLWIDDVLIGGILPQKLGHELVKFVGGHDSAYLLPSHGSWKIADHMFLLGTRNELLPDVIRKIWRAALQFSY